MAETHSRKHHTIQIKEKHSKGGSLTGLLLKLFNWNGWLLKKGIPKKLPSAEWSQVSKGGGKDERLHMLPRLVTISDEKDASSAAITRAKDTYYMVQAMPTEDGMSLRKPGVVARLMGLDFIPCSPSHKVNAEVHPQGAPTVTPTGKQYFKPKDINLTAKVDEKGSKKVTVNKQLHQRQLARSLDMNLQKISKTSFLNYASKPLLQKEDIKRMPKPNSVSPHLSRSIQPPSKSVSKLKSTQKSAQSKRATLLLEAAVKILEPSLRSGDPNRPLLVQALMSRTAPERISDKKVSLEKSDSGKLCHKQTKGEVPERGSAIISRIQLPSHKKLARSHASAVAIPHEAEKQKALIIEATQNLSEQFQHTKLNAGVITEGHLRLDTPSNSFEPKPKAEKEVLLTRQLHKLNFHNEAEKVTDKTNDRLLRTGHERATMIAVENPTISSKNETANSRLSQIQREDHEQTVNVIQLDTEMKLERKPQMTEISLDENLSGCSRTIRSSKDKRSGKTNQEVISRNQEKHSVREASMVQTVQEKPSARRALADFSKRRNQNFANTRRKSLSKSFTENHSQKSGDVKSTSDELPATLDSCTEPSLSLMDNQNAGSQELVIDLFSSLSTNPTESWKVCDVDERSTQEISNDSSSEGQCVDNDVDLIGSECDNSVNRPCEAVLAGKREEQSQVSETKIQLCARDDLCAKHEDGELPNGNEVTGYALKDDTLEDILRNMLSTTIANVSSNEKEHQNDGGDLLDNITKDFVACDNYLEGRAENNETEEIRAPSLSLELKSTPLSENTAATPRCAERVIRPDYIEDSGQPSPVSVLELPFEDEDTCSWRGEDFSVTVMGELHTRPSLETTDTIKSLSTCKRNLLTNSNSSSGEIVREAILHNLKKRFLYLFPVEDKENNEMEFMQYKATDTSGHKRINLVEHQQLHGFATAKTWTDKEGYSSKTLEASNFYDKLLSDCAKEVLTPKLSFLRYTDVWCHPSYHELTALGRQIVDEAYKQITMWSQLNLSTINDLVDRDLSIPAENWTDFQNKKGETGAKLECIIFKEILDELVSDLATSNTRNASLT